MTDRAKIENVELEWACLNHTNDLSGKYQVDLVRLTEEQQKALLALGPLTLRTRSDKPEKGVFITAKSMHPILAVNPDGSPVTVKVANGSKATVVCNAYPFKRKAPNGGTHGLSIGKLILTDLKEFDGFEDEDL